MRPLRLVMRAFGPYAGEQALDFTPLGARACFLVHGPTGAGKTSILDAICFALYGESSGGERDARRLRSDHADAAMPTEVVFDFSLGSESYRVSRSPEQERPKSRGAGTTTQRPKATLWRRTAVAGLDDAHPVVGCQLQLGARVDGEVIASQPTTVNDEVERLLGFSRQQFSQVVVLPQGKFRELLQSDSAKREEILEVLFQTSDYGRIEELLKKRAAAARTALEDIDRERGHYLNEADVAVEADLEAQRLAQRDVIEAVVAAIEERRQAKAAADEALRAGRERHKQAAERREAETALDDLEGRAAGIEQVARGVESARRAATLAEIDASAEARNQERVDAGTALAECERGLARAGDVLKQAAERFERERQREPERDAARAAITRLEGLAESVGSLAAATARKTQLAADAKKQRSAMQRMEASREKLEQRAEQARAEHEAARASSGELKARTAAVKAAARALEQASKVEKARRDLSLVQVDLDGAVQAGKEKDATARRAAEALERIEAEWAAGQAGLLARELRDDEPCPVCGSTDHPRPARSKRRLVERTEVDAARTVLREAQDAKAAAAEAASAIRAEAKSLEATIAGLVGGEGETAASLRRALKKAQDALHESEAASSRLPALADGQQAARDEVAVQVKALKTAAENLQRLERDAGIEDGRVRVLERTVPEEVRNPKALDTALGERRAALARLVEALEKARAGADEAALAHSRAQQSLLAARDGLATATKKAEQSHQRLLQSIEDAGFDSEAAYRTARMDSETVKALSAEVQSFNERLAAARDRVVRAREASPSTDVPDLALLESRASNLTKELEEKVRAQGQEVERLQRIGRWLDELQRLAARRETARAEYGCLAHVSKVVNGDNALGVTLQRYVLAALLDEVLDTASVRLRAMTRGRFELERESARGDARRAGGLDLVVHDAWTGTTRPVNTLSGGEGFLASLALALGLADVVSSYAAGIRLETIFVDEGFGNLDDEALDLALQTLMHLRDSGRLVGIISHVAELRDRIDARLEVLPGANGSTARFVL